MGNKNPEFTADGGQWNPRRYGSVTWRVSGANGTVQFYLDDRKLPGNSGGTVTSEDGSLTMTRGADWKTSVVITSTGSDGLALVKAKAGNQTITGGVFVGTLIVYGSDGRDYQAPSENWTNATHSGPPKAASYALTVDDRSGILYYVSRDALEVDEDLMDKDHPWICYKVTAIPGGDKTVSESSTIYAFPPNRNGTVYNPPSGNMYCCSKLEPAVAGIEPEDDPVNVACFVLNLEYLEYQQQDITYLDAEPIDNK